MTEVAVHYGQALYDLAKSEDLSNEILTQILTLNDSFCQEPDFLRLLRSANLSVQQRCGIIDDSFKGKLHEYVVNFLKILTEKNYIRHFPDCVAAYRQQYNLDNHILPVTAVTAVALTQEQAGKLTNKLSAITGQTIDLTNRVDPSVMGGVRLDYHGKRLDDTVSHRLESVRSMLQKAGTLWN